MRYLAILSVLALAACGVDGEPERPTGPSTGPTTGIAITGTASIGISGSS